jgi:phosphoribosylanthranilate isomerase
VTFVKICGILDVDSAHAAVEAGADAIGFVFAPGRRCIAPQKAREIIRRLPPGVLSVGVFVDEEVKTVSKIARYCGLSALQFHGRESPEYCGRFTLPVIKALGVDAAGRHELDRAGEYARVWALLVDTRVAGRCGGTGQSFDWHILVSRVFPRPLILAGGLDPGNVRRAIRTVRPFGVDVSSGVETGGRKDPQKIRSFVREVKAG